MTVPTQFSGYSETIYKVQLSSVTKKVALLVVTNWHRQSKVKQNLWECEMSLLISGVPKYLNKGSKNKILAFLGRRKYGLLNNMENTHINKHGLKNWVTLCVLFFLCQIVNTILERCLRVYYTKTQLHSATCSVCVSFTCAGTERVWRGPTAPQTCRHYTPSEREKGEAPGLQCSGNNSTTCPVMNIQPTWIKTSQ